MQWLMNGWLMVDGSGCLMVGYGCLMLAFGWLPRCSRIATTLWSEKVNAASDRGWLSVTIVNRHQG